jgi:hypothetical protein
VLLIVNAEDNDEIHRQLADDPWILTGQLVTCAQSCGRIAPVNVESAARRVSLVGSHS